MNQTKEVKHIESANDGQQDSETIYHSGTQHSSYATYFTHKIRKVPQLLLLRNYMIARVHKAIFATWLQCLVYQWHSLWNNNCDKTCSPLVEIFSVSLNTTTGNLGIKLISSIILKSFACRVTDIMICTDVWGYFISLSTFQPFYVLSIVDKHSRNTLQIPDSCKYKAWTKSTPHIQMSFFFRKSEDDIDTWSPNHLFVMLVFVVSHLWLAAALASALTWPHPWTQRQTWRSLWCPQWLGHCWGCPSRCSLVKK